MDRRQAMKTLALGAAALPLLPGGAFALGDPPAGLPSSALSAGTPPAKEPFSLPPLRYPFDALEPHFDAQTMQLHHDAPRAYEHLPGRLGRKEVEG
jgi:Fe-Mn family superoxide dismutase